MTPALWLATALIGALIGWAVSAVAPIDLVPLSASITGAVVAVVGVGLGVSVARVLEGNV
jgi:lysozyme family protein